MKHYVILVVLCFTLNQPVALADENIRKPGLWELEIRGTSPNEKPETKSECVSKESEQLIQKFYRGKVRDTDSYCREYQITPETNGYLEKMACFMDGVLIRTTTRRTQRSETLYEEHVESEFDPQLPSGEGVSKVVQRVQASYKGVCGPSFKEGDIVLGGMKTNVFEVFKLNGGGLTNGANGQSAEKSHPQHLNPHP
jgi:hypothetical protein